MKDEDYDSLIQRSNEINAAKTQINRLLKEGKTTVKMNGRRMNINTRLEQLKSEHNEVIRKLNEMHRKGKL